MVTAVAHGVLRGHPTRSFVRSVLVVRSVSRVHVVSLMGRRRRMRWLNRPVDGELWRCRARFSQGIADVARYWSSRTVIAAVAHPAGQLIHRCDAGVVRHRRGLSDRVDVNCGHSRTSRQNYFSNGLLGGPLHPGDLEHCGPTVGTHWLTPPCIRFRVARPGTSVTRYPSDARREVRPAIRRLEDGVVSQDNHVLSLRGDRRRLAWHRTPPRPRSHPRQLTCEGSRRG